MYKSYFYLTETSSERSYDYVMSNGKCKLLNCAIITLCHVLVKLELTFGDDLDMFNVNNWWMISVLLLTYHTSI